MSDIYNSSTVRTFINNIKVRRITDVEISDDYCIIRRIHGSEDGTKIENSIQNSEKIKIRNIHDEFVMGVDFLKSEYRRVQGFPMEEVSIIYYCFGDFEDRLNEMRRNDVINNSIIEGIKRLETKDKNITINIEKLVQPKISSKYE